MPVRSEPQVSAWRPALGGLTSLLLGCLLQSLPGETRASTLAVRDDRGMEWRFNGTPGRIVSLLPSLTESVCVLGGCARIVGTDRYSNWPASVRALPKLGGLDDAVIEAIVALKPDVVLAAVSTRALARLESLGLKVLAFRSDRHEEVRSSLQRLALLLGEPARADAVWQRIEREMQQAAARVPPAWHGRSVYFEADSAPYAAGEGSFVGQTLARLGLTNIAVASMGPFPRLNPEYVVRADPALLIAAHRNMREMHERAGWRGLSALRASRHCAFAEEAYELLIRPGPRMGEAAQAIATCVAALPPPPAAHAR